MSAASPLVHDAAAASAGHASLLTDANQLTELHALAFTLYAQQSYLEASHCYRLLTLSCPSEALYWKGLGAALQMLKDYEEALFCYFSAQRLGPGDPYLYVHAADCHLALHERAEALAALAAAQKIAEQQDEQRILKHVALMRAQWLDHKN